MKNNKSLLDIAKENVLEIALELERSIRYIDALQRFGWSMFSNIRYNAESKDFTSGLQQARDALYARYCRALADCFLWVGVDEGIKDKSLEMLKERFKTESRMEIMGFLEKYGNVPNSYYEKDSQTFRAEVLEEIEKVKTNS